MNGSILNNRCRLLLRRDARASFADVDPKAPGAAKQFQAAIELFARILPKGGTKIE